MTRKPRLPFGMTHPPRTAKTTATLATIDDHLGKSDLMAWTWWSGEGFTLEIQEYGKVAERIDISWTQWDALQLVVKELDRKDEHA